MSDQIECKVGKCPICDGEVTVQVNLTPGEMDEPAPGGPTWMLLRTTALHHLFQAVLRYASKMTLWERKQLIDAITCERACEGYGPEALSNLADFLEEGGVKCREKASKQVEMLTMLQDEAR